LTTTGGAGNNVGAQHPLATVGRVQEFEGEVSNFDRASARVNRSVAEAAERLEKDSAELIAYLNNEVVPAVRQHSSKALRVAAEKLVRLADYMEETQRPK
jgi:hypothetical protein